MYEILEKYMKYIKNEIYEILEKCMKYMKC